MKDQIKYIMIGVIVGIAIGMITLYSLITFRIVRPFGFGGFGQFGQNNNLTNFPRPSRGE